MAREHGAPEHGAPERLGPGPGVSAGPAYPEQHGHREPTGHPGHTQPTGHAEPVGQAEYTEHTEPAEHTESAGSTEPTGQAGRNETPGHTGQWTIPVADGDLPEESGEFAASALASSWYTDTPPATLPGGAAAPWAEHLQGERDIAGSGADAPDGQAETATRDEGAPEALREPAEAPGTPEEAPGASEPPGTSPEPSETASETAPVAVPGPVSEAAVPLTQEPAPAPHAAHPEEPTAESPADPPAEVTADPSAGAPGDAPSDTPPVPAPDPLPETEPGTASPAAEPVAPGAVADAEADTGEPDAQVAVPSEHPAASYVLHVNGVDRPVGDAWIGESLLYVLRERLGLAGAKDGCSQGECGACNVQVDGRLVASCLVPAATTAGSEIRTVEGLAVDGEPSDIQRALAACGAVQCGFCIPGMAMTVHDLLEGNHAPTELETRQALCGNLCRCSGYRGVLDAVREVIESRDADGPDDEPRIPHQAPPGAGGVQAQPHEGDAR
ncbi:2Fe-2S iron-sulfur cluster-binding protein [Streptomyces sp. NRRL WC-3549]|uniref:2Fe-2S iron-sulfur cluster-binding protein n=1 Tax=Streptomyces sp. NRRL WC-3549 TaxID=1463925 RepID=UPI0009EC7838